jgi:hypothetical protein
MNRKGPGTALPIDQPDRTSPSPGEKQVRSGIPHPSTSASASWLNACRAASGVHLPLDSADYQSSMQALVNTTRKMKRVIQESLPSRYAPIVVASMGRAGSTLVHDSLCSGMAAARFPYAQGIGIRIVRDYAWNLGEVRLYNGVVYKTHALAQELPPDSKARVVFLYGRASNAVLSVLSCNERYGSEWIEAHFEHLRAQGSLEELPTKDVLRIEEQVNGWLSGTRQPVLGLRYETLWDHIGVLSDFAGFPVTLPQRRPRSGALSVGEATRNVVMRSYASLDERINKLPDYVLIN